MPLTTPPMELQPESTRGPLGEGYGLSVGNFCIPETSPLHEATLIGEKPSPEELAMVSQASMKNTSGEGYSLSVGDFCLPETAPIHEATIIDEKPSPEELAMVSQASMKNPSGEGYGLSVGDFCLPESAPTQEAIYKKPSPEELAMVSKAAMKNTSGEGYGLSVGDFCLPESAPTQEAIDKKPSPEELAMASQSAMAFGQVAQELTVPPVQSDLLQNMGETMPQLPIKNEPISDSEEPISSTANQQVKEEFSMSEMQESAPSIVQVPDSDIQGNPSTRSGSSLPPEVLIGSPPWETNSMSTDLQHPHSQAQMQQSRANLKTLGELLQTVENPLLKKVLTMHREKFPSSASKLVQIEKSDEGYVAIVFPSNGMKQPPILPLIRVPSLKRHGHKGNTRKFSPQMTKINKKLKIKTVTMPITQSDLTPQKFKIKMKKKKKTKKKEKEKRRKSKDLTKVFQEEEVEQDKPMLEKNDEEEETEEEYFEEYDVDDEEFNEVGIDDTDDSDYKPSPRSFRPYHKKRKIRDLGKEATKSEVSRLESSVSSDEDKTKGPQKKRRYLTRKKKREHLDGAVTESEVSRLECHEDMTKYSKKKRQKTRTEWLTLRATERRKHVLKCQLAERRQLHLECKLCKDILFTVQDFQLHFEEKHPGEAEKLATDLELTLERKRIAFDEQKEREAQERKDELVKMMKRKETREKNAEEKRAAREKKSAQIAERAAEQEKKRLEMMAILQSQQRKSTRLGLKKPKTAFELLGLRCETLRCETSNEMGHSLDTQSSTTDPEMAPKSSSNRNITMHEMDELRDDIHEDTKLLMDSILHEIEQQETENKDSYDKTEETMYETDAQMTNKNEDDINPTSQETNAPRVDESKLTLSLPHREEHQSHKQETETSNESQYIRCDLEAKSSEHVAENEPVDMKNGCSNEQLVMPLDTAVNTDNKLEADDASAEIGGKLQAPTSLESVGDASEHTSHGKSEDIYEDRGTLGCREIRRNDPSETLFNQGIQSEQSEQALNSPVNTDSTNLDKFVDGRPGKLDQGAQTSRIVNKSEAEENKMRSSVCRDGRSITHQDEPTSMDGMLPCEEGAEVEFVPEVDVDVMFELDAWSNILLECTKCSSFIGFWQYSAHLNAHDKRREIGKCGKCGSKYYSEGGLSRHQKRYCKGKREVRFGGVCEICGKFVAHVQFHLRTHQEHTLSCKICNATFARKCSLDRHMNVHSSVKEHVCEICGRGFSQWGNLKGHMRQHTQEKPYKCDMCDKSFVHNVSLKSHQKRDHGMDPWLGTNTAPVGRRKKERDDSSENTAEKRRTQKKTTDEDSCDETAVKRKRGRKKK